MSDLFHLSPARNRKAIERYGIRGDSDGRIFLFTDMVVANVIAKDQVFTDRYDVFSISPRYIVGRVESDRVAEFSAAYQRILHQHHVPAAGLAHVGTFDVVTDRATEWDYLIGSRLGKSRAMIDAERDVFRWMESMHGKLPDDEIVAEANRRFQAAAKVK